MLLKGRENAHADIAKENVVNFIKKINDKMNIKEEQKIEKQGKKITAIIVKKQIITIHKQRLDFRQ